MVHNLDFEKRKMKPTNIYQSVVIPSLISSRTIFLSIDNPNIPTRAILILNNPI